jgi:hypothetical protein
MVRAIAISAGAVAEIIGTVSVAYQKKRANRMTITVRVQRSIIISFEK